MNNDPHDQWNLWHFCRFKNGERCKKWEIFLTHSISCCDQMSGKKNLRKERFILAYGSRGIIPLWQGRQVAKSRQMAHQTASILTKQRMNRKWAWLSDFKPHLLKPMFLGEFSPLSRFYDWPSQTAVPFWDYVFKLTNLQEHSILKPQHMFFCHWWGYPGWDPCHRALGWLLFPCPLVIFQSL